jgi:SH3 domain-containing YSC84-like protein 1
VKILYLVSSVCVSALWLQGAADTARDRLRDSTDILNEIMKTPDKGIPQDLLSKAHCVAIVPGLKQAAFVIGGKYGKGFVSCRETGRGWGAPAAFTIEGGSVGFQIGASATDIVMLIMSERGMRSLLQDKFTLGADANVAAGPVGRYATAQTDVQLTADILTWSRSKGLFAGIALTGAVVKPDKNENAAMYGRDLGAREILEGNTKPPADAQPLVAELTRLSPHEAPNQPAETRAKDKITGSGNANRSKNPDK